MRTLVIVSLAFLVLACQDATPVQPELGVAPEMAVAQAPGGANDVVKMVPYKGKGTFRVTGSDFTQCGGDPELVSLMLEGDDWTGPLIGRATAAWTNCYTAEMELVSQTGTITTANGDLLYFYSITQEHGTRLIIYPDNTYEIGPTLFSGGTGRFENAQGWIHCWGTSNAEVTAGTIYSDGWISSVGSSK